jgi:hypothetical protein
VIPERESKKKLRKVRSSKGQREELNGLSQKK